MSSMTMRKTRTVLAVLLMVACGVAACWAWSADKAGNSTAAEQALVIEVMVPAPIGDVWKAFTTSEGLSTWLTPNAVVDLREGGEWTAKFPGGSTGGGTILSFVPEKELVLSALAPDKFPTVRATRTKARFQFE
ncbi:MAG TPA: SRPBCC domain-containing protein, partial [Edaphobacter sp.]|nr:SRPBCC domain-containing protein [Edaphobacter sp.]